MDLSNSQFFPPPFCCSKGCLISFHVGHRVSWIPISIKRYLCFAFFKTSVDLFSLSYGKTKTTASFQLESTKALKYLKFSLSAYRGARRFFPSCKLLKCDILKTRVPYKNLHWVLKKHHSRARCASRSVQNSNSGIKITRGMSEKSEGLYSDPVK